MPNPAYNLNYLNEIFEGNSKSVKEVVEIFLGELPESKELMQASINKKDRENLRRVVHKLKSSLKTIGAYELAGIAAQIENKAEINFKEVEKLTNNFQRLLPDLESQLTEYLKEQK